MPSKLFQRSCTITVDSVEVTNKDGNGLRMAFEVKQSVDSKSNTANAIIYNLNESSRGRLLKESTQFIIKAGYAFTGADLSAFGFTVLPVGLIFKGKASSIQHIKADVGWETRISAEDGLEEKRAIINESLAPGASISQLVQSIAGEMRVNVKKSLARAKQGDFDGALKTFQNGFVLSGTAQIELDKLTASIGADWSIVNGELQILLPNETTEEEAIVLSPESGLIGSPETQWKKIETKGGEKSTSKKLVLKCMSLLQPGLTPGRRIRVKSRAIKGDFRCVDVTHSGDTDSDEWKSQIEGISVGPPETVIDVAPIGTIA